MQPQNTATNHITLFLLVKLSPVCMIFPVVELRLLYYYKVHSSNFLVFLIVNILFNGIQNSEKMYYS